jgi:hypothetical protein
VCVPHYDNVQLFMTRDDGPGIKIGDCVQPNLGWARSMEFVGAEPPLSGDRKRSRPFIELVAMNWSFIGEIAVLPLDIK